MYISQFKDQYHRSRMDNLCAFRDVSCAKLVMFTSPLQFSYRPLIMFIFYLWHFNSGLLQMHTKRRDHWVWWVKSSWCYFSQEERYMFLLCYFCMFNHFVAITNKAICVCHLLSNYLVLLAKLIVFYFYVAVPKRWIANEPANQHILTILPFSVKVLVVHASVTHNLHYDSSFRRQ